MMQTTMDPYETLARTLSTGQGKSDSKEASQQLSAIAQAPDNSVRRFEQLILAAKSFIFTVIVKTAHSLLPICSSCKKIRDDKGYWQQVDAYIAGHFSTIEFTHGICPDCAKRLYPQYFMDTSKAA